MPTTVRLSNGGRPTTVRLAGARGAQGPQGDPGPAVPEEQLTALRGDIADDIGTPASAIGTALITAIEDGVADKVTKGEQVVSLLDHGGVADPATNNAAALAAAITASGWPANRARIVVPPGEYGLTGATIDAAGLTSTPELTIDARGAKFVTTTDAATMLTVTNSAISSTHINLVGGQFLVNANGATGVLLHNAEFVTLRDVSFLGSFATAIKITGTSTYNTVTGCKFNNLSRGIEIAGAADYLSVMGCHFAEELSGSPLDWIGQTGVTLSNGIRIVGNTFYATGATRQAIYLSHGANVVISSNTFEQCAKGAIYLGFGGTFDRYTISSNAFRNTGNADDIYIAGANRGTIQGNVFDVHVGGTTGDTYCNIRLRDPFGGAQGSGVSIIGNTSQSAAADLLYMVYADASCTNLAVVGNIGRAGVQAAHVSNYLAGNLAA